MEIYQESFWIEYMKQFDLPSSYFQHITNFTNKFCVIIETRKLESLVLVIKNFMYLLQDKKWGFIVYHGTDNEKFIKSNLENIPNIIYINMGISNMSVNDYNQLLLSQSFWKQLLHNNCEHCLIYQTDTALFKDNVDEFIQYDYIGAPWVNNLHEILELGNGGLSLRSVWKMLYILDNHEIIGHWHEDCFFSYWCIKDKFHFPDKKTAQQFSVETIFYEDPCGVHKPLLEKFPDKREQFIQLFSKRFF